MLLYLIKFSMQSLPGVQLTINRSVMALSHHYLIQCCPRYIMPYGSIWPQWVNTIYSFLVYLIAHVWGKNKVFAHLEKNHYIDGLVQERRNSIANIMELHLSCTNLSISRLYWHAKCIWYPELPPIHLKLLPIIPRVAGYRWKGPYIPVPAAILTWQTGLNHTILGRQP